MRRRSSAASWFGAGAFAALLLVSSAARKHMAGWLPAVLLTLHSGGMAGALLYALLYIAGTVLWIPGTLLTVGAGALYGTIGGVLVAVPASLAGASLSFLIARSAGRTWLLRRFAGSPRLLALDEAVTRLGWKMVLLMRLDPIFLPFAPLNYALGLTGIRFREYLLASWLGMLPATVLYVFLGSFLPSLHQLVAGSPAVPRSWRQAMILVGAGVGATLMWGLIRLLRTVLGRQLGASPFSKES